MSTLFSRLLHFVRLITTILVTGLIFTTHHAMAESAGTTTQPEQMTVSLAATPFYQFAAGLNNGGEVAVTRLFFDIGTTRSVSRELDLGVHLGYDYADYHFTGPVALGGVKPWSDIHRLELGGSFDYDITPEMSLYVAPSVQFSRAGDAGWGNALGYGGVVAMNYSLSPRLTLGAGVAAFSEIEEVTVFPVLLIRWQISDRLLLANPFRPGPTGPAGIELGYRVGDAWDLAAGATYRSSRFRLDNAGAIREGIGESSQLPVFGRLSWKPGNLFNLDCYAGVIFGGALYLEDRNGNSLFSDHYDPAPFVSLALSSRF